MVYRIKKGQSVHKQIWHELTCISFQEGMVYKDLILKKATQDYFSQSGEKERLEMVSSDDSFEILDGFQVEVKGKVSQQELQDPDFE